MSANSPQRHPKLVSYEYDRFCFLQIVRLLRSEPYLRSVALEVLPPIRQDTSRQPLRFHSNDRVPVVPWLCEICAATSMRFYNCNPVFASAPMRWHRLSGWSPTTWLGTKPSMEGGCLEISFPQLQLACSCS